MFLIEKPLPQAHALISWLSQFSHFLNLFPTESLILLRFLALEIWWNMFLMATCLGILSHSCSFPANSGLYCWAFFDSSFTACTRYLCFFLSANRSQEPLREFCQHYIISIFSFNSERYFGFKSEDTDWRLHCYFVDFFLFSQLYSLTKEDESLCKVHAKRKFLMT